MGSAKEIETAFPGTCAVFLVDRELVLKLYPPFLVSDFFKEREIVERIGGQISALPRLLATGVYRDRIDWPYLIFEYRRGQPIRELRAELGPGEKQTLASEIGHLIRQVHETPLVDFVSIDGRSQAWSRFLEKRRAACLGELSNRTSLTDPILDEVSAFLDTVELTSPGFTPLLINADLTEDHLLLLQQGRAWRISALLDWADAEAGAADYEWVALWFGLCDRDPDMFRQIIWAYNPTLTLEASFHNRVLAYTFLHRFGADIIAGVFARNDYPPARSLAELEAQLWSPL